MSDVLGAKMAALVPGNYAIAWRPKQGRKPGRWVQRRIVDVTWIGRFERIDFDELDPLRSGQPPRSSCKRDVLARWADHILAAPVAYPLRPNLPVRLLELRAG